MNSDPFRNHYEYSRHDDAPSVLMLPEEEEALPLDERQAYRPRVLAPAILFVLTCLSTFLVGAASSGSWAGGLMFSSALMFTLLAHEFGHFLQARRYHVPASLPYFLPFPLRPIGTLGAVIAMHPSVGDRKSLFDIAITGPLAGLVPAMAFSVAGLQMSQIQPLTGPLSERLGAPLLFQWLSHAILGPVPEAHIIALHPLAFAGWVGVFITALNLIPIGQLDGGHILYALMRRRAHGVATLFLLAAAVGVVVYQYWGWSLMILILLFMGPRHPPTADDSVPLGPGRVALGWLSLLFVVVGFTPQPFIFT